MTEMTVQGFVSARRDRRAALIILLAICAVVGTAIYGQILQGRSKPSSWTFTDADTAGTVIISSGSGTIRSGMVMTGSTRKPGGPITPEERRTFTEARAAWDRALPERQRRLIHLEATDDRCGESAIACADITIDAVYLKIRGHRDLKTVFMHEIAHLYGVPHIAGDPLMDSEFQGHDLKQPTDLAVLIAKYRLTHPPTMSEIMH